MPVGSFCVCAYSFHNIQSGGHGLVLLCHSQSILSQFGEESVPAVGVDEGVAALGQLLGQHLGVDPTNSQLGAVQGTEQLRGAVGVKVTVGVDDPLHILGIKPSAPGTFDEQRGGTGKARIQQEQSIASIDKTRALPACPPLISATIPSSPQFSR